MKRADGLLLVACAALHTALLTGCSSSDSEKPSLRLERFTSKARGISVMLPRDWTWAEGVSGTVVAAAAQTANDVGSVPPTINLVIDAKPEEATLDEVFGSNVAGIKQRMPDAEMLENGELATEGGRSRFLLLAATRGKSKQKSIAYLLVRGPRTYVITCTSDASSFDKHRPTFDKVAASFRFESTAGQKK